MTISQKGGLWSHVDLLSLEGSELIKADTIPSSFDLDSDLQLRSSLFTSEERVSFRFIPPATRYQFIEFDVVGLKNSCTLTVVAVTDYRRDLLTYTGPSVTGQFKVTPGARRTYRLPYIGEVEAFIFSGFSGDAPVNIKAIRFFTAPNDILPVVAPETTSETDVNTAHLLIGEAQEPRTGDLYQINVPAGINLSTSAVFTLDSLNISHGLIKILVSQANHVDISVVVTDQTGLTVPYVIKSDYAEIFVTGEQKTVSLLFTNSSGTSASSTLEESVEGSASSIPVTIPAVLEFSGNNVLQYDTTNPGVVYARTKDAAVLGTGGTTYAAAASTRSAIYNYKDDKMYFLATKTVGAVVTNVLIQFNPRTLVIDGEMLLPTGWTVANSLLVDCTDTRAWIRSTFDGTFRAFDITTLTQSFNDGGALTTIAGTIDNAISGFGGKLLTQDATNSLLLHRITVTGASTFTNELIVVPGDTGTGNVPFLTGNGSYRRRWCSNNDSVLIGYIDGGVVGNITNILVSMALGVAGAVSPQYAPATKHYELSTKGPFWDKIGQAFAAGVTGTDTGIAVINEAGLWVGIAALNSSTWAAANGILGNGFAWARSLTTDAYAGFAMNTPITTPVEIYTTSDAFVSPGTHTFVAGFECIAPALPSSGGGGDGGNGGNGDGGGTETGETVHVCLELDNFKAIQRTNAFGVFEGVLISPLTGNLRVL